MHTIWMREHNRIAAALGANNPSWDSERVFQTARAIVVAEIQKITFKDYLPILLGDAMSLIEPYTGYKENIDPNIPNGFATAAFRFGHSQVNPNFDRLGNNYKPLSIGPLNLLDAFFDPSQFEKSGGTDPILRGLLTSQSRKVDEFVNNILTNHLFQTDGSSHGLDLASLNIQRGRDHGLPPYLTWRRWAERECNLSGYLSGKDVYESLLKIYGSLETVDLWVGGLAEMKVPGGLVGPTFACIFAKTFEALRDGDRFYYENPDSLFTMQQQKEIEKTSLSRIICDNSDGIISIQSNAFLAGQKRESCSSKAINQIDIAAWTDIAEKCYLKVSVSGKSSIETVSVPGEALTITSDSGVVCVPFSCPSRLQDTVKITVSAKSKSRYSSRSCKMWPYEFGFRPTQKPFTTTAELGKLNQKGFYDSIDSCKKGKNLNAIMSCRIFETANTANDEQNVDKIFKFLLELLQ